ncbi:hypothetical protein JL722_7556 [Aureococcus anophagefferens]|nr:hypothetical protein JL722_7556 [Aureococcus anophagefferens]
MALDMGLFHDPLDTNGVKTLPPISGAFDILGGDPMAGVLTTSQKSVGLGHPPRRGVLAGGPPARGGPGRRRQPFANPFGLEVPTLKFDTSAPRVPERRYTSKSARAKADLERTRRAKQETFGPELSLYSGFLDDLSPEGEAAATTYVARAERRKAGAAERRAAADARKQEAKASKEGDRSPSKASVASGGSERSGDGATQRTVTTARTTASGADGLTASVNRIRTYTNLLQQHSLHHFIIWKGKRLHATPEFGAFRRRYAVRWSGISHIVGLLEDLCLQKAVTLALVDGAAVDALAKCDLARLKVADLRACVHNMDHSQARRKLAVATVLKGIARLRSERATHWDALSARLRRDAAHLAPGAERVEIHVPSLGHSEHRVLSLARGGSGDDGDADGDPASTPRPGASSRFTVIVPELVRRFPAHFTLASLALYSPSCCRRLYHLSAGRFAVIVPGGPVGWAEKALALRLDVPLLGPDPSRAALYGSRSGAKRVLHVSDVNIPWARDIYDEEDFCVALAKLVAGHLDVARWKFGVDADARADAGASGVAYLDVDDLDVVRDLRHEQRRLTALDRHKGEAAWHHPDVQVLARSKLLRSLRVALAARAVVCYPGKRPEGGAWPSFMALVQRYGGVIEAEPRDVVGHSCVHAFVRPDGVVSVRAAQDVLSTDGYERIVAVHPAAAAPVEALAGATAAVARRLFDRGVPRGIQIFNPTSIYVLVPGFYHPGLAALKYSSFFKLCRLHGIAFDLAKRRGPVLLLVDSLASGVVGAVTEGANKLDALRLCHKFLTFVRKHVDTAHLIHHVAGPADRELPDLIHVVNGALRPLEHMISSLAIGPELAAPLIHDRRRLPQPDDAATPV